ncbi:hypothetical protein [Flavobacterium reichenbachii]|uniref:Uncharacterized protein n=1 Tax=Flavobacterium reichenbachii TaxID=362418 RepID=A0A085ZFP7_9FLAO|nr:hypothetical protein [Flavobacterium reichenbachii]KFF03261.1 hypothetical protein IW19_20395 [Flavobacterium reichenbachii]OXB15242.1 hypothetical protein B0A68_11005 [Flavobacterium reichenbachii]
MKISKTILEIILPITIGTIIFISYFLIIEKLTSEPELEPCERYELSSIVYLIFAFGIILISSLYQIIVGNWILRRNKNKFMLNIVNSIIFGAFFTVIFTGMEVFNGKAIEVEFCTGFFLVMVILGLIFSVLKSVFEKLLNKV